MGKNLFVGVGGKARHVKALYVGVGGKARKVKKVYVGVGGKARLVWQSYVPVTGISLSSYNNTDPANQYIYISITPSNATDQTITFSYSGDDNIRILKYSDTMCHLYCGPNETASGTLTATSRDGVVKQFKVAHASFTWLAPR